MTKVLIGAMGRTRFDGAEYVFDNGRREISSYFIHALAKDVQPDKVIFLLTTDAHETHWEGQDGIQYWFKGDFPDAELIPASIPTGGNQDEAWMIFKAIADEIPENAHVYVDITNGLRSIPSLMLSAIKYLQFAKNITISEIYYCAFESVDWDASKPTYSLALFSVLLDWANAVDMFRRTGNSTLLADLLEHSPENTLGSVLNLNEIAKLLRHLSLSLELIRPESVMKDSAQLIAKLDDMQLETLPARLQPFGLLLDHLRTDFRQFVLHTPRSTKETKNFLEKKRKLYQWYLEHNNPSNAVLLACEWFISWYLYKYEDIRGSELFQSEKRHIKDTELSSTSDHITDLWWKISNLRNDLAHCGMRESPEPPESLNEKVEKTIARINELSL